LHQKQRFLLLSFSSGDAYSKYTESCQICYKMMKILALFPNKLAKKNLSCNSNSVLFELHSALHDINKGLKKGTNQTSTGSIFYILDYLSIIFKIRRVKYFLNDI
jgi:hypothetical protein